MTRFTRRTLLASALLSACSTRKRAKRYAGWLFVASGAERAIAVANLSDFRRMTTIPLAHAPDLLLAGQKHVYSLSGEGAEVLEIDPATLKITARMPLPGKPLTARFADEHSAGILLITIESPAQIIALNLANRTIIGRTPLPGPAVDLDVNGQNAAVAIPSQRAIVRLSATNLKVAGTTSVGVPCQVLRFRNDGRTILAGSADARQVVTVDVASGALLARLPLPLAPSHFCFNSDGGQMFVTGAGQDSVTIVSPYQNEVGETMLAGRTPDAMVISVPRNLLLVTNRETGDLTILDIETRHLSASVHVGGVPGEVMVTPDGEYALVLDRASGSVSVVRLDTVLEPNKGDAPAAVVQLRTKPLFTTFATAGDARSALIVPSPVA